MIHFCWIKFQFWYLGLRSDILTTKEEQIVDWPRKLQITNLVGLCFGLAVSRLVDTLIWISILCNENSLNLPCYITSRVHIIQSQSGVPPLSSSLLSTTSGQTHTTIVDLPWTFVLFIPFFVFGFWLLLAKKLRRYEILPNLCLHLARQHGQDQKKWKENNET